MRQRCILQSRSHIQDCLVIGAGINGAVAAATLACKGAGVTVIDRGDFASGTSQESSNLAWGGIKYLETGEFGLVWKLCQCRNQLMSAYPSQIEETRFLSTIAAGFRRPVLLVYGGALLYWALGRFRTRPPHLLTRATIRRRAPMIRDRQIAGGLEYSDARLVENDARFTFGFVQKVLAQHQNAINYMELVGATRHDGLWHCTLEDRVSGQTTNLRARTVVNAAGPSADRVNQLLGIPSPFRHVFSKGVHIIVPRLSKKNMVLAFFASDGRLFFMIPMGSRTCIGTTDSSAESEAVVPTAADIDFLLNNTNTLLDLEKPLTRDEIIATRCGVRPLVVGADHRLEKVEWVTLSRRHEIAHDDRANVLTIYGGKISDCINVGNEIATIIKSFGIDLPRADASWYGEPTRSRAEQFMAAGSKVVGDDQISRNLWRRYGEAAFTLLEQIRSDRAMGEPLLEGYLRAEIHHIARAEMVVHLEDFLRRRTMISLTVKPQTLRRAPGLAEAARILFDERAPEEINRYFEGKTEDPLRP